jgi:glycogen debranching enzyme
LFPYIKKEHPDWRERYEKYNKPGEYHNGGVWPYVSGIYIAALVAAKRYDLARKKLQALTQAIKKSSSGTLDFGFNEWIRAQDGIPGGQDWQSWSAALYLYAVKCVEEKRTPFFDDMRHVAGSVTASG